MKILWTVNTLMPEVASAIGAKSGHAISWVDAMSKRLSVREGVSLAIATRTASAKTVKRFNIGNIVYYVLPCDCDRVDYWKCVIDEFKPDVIHVYGTETNQNKLLVEKYQESVPVIISLQGILSEYQRHYYAGIDFSTMLRFTTIKDILRPSGFFTGRRSFIKRSALEKELLRSVRYVEGRSTWDRVSAMNINPELIYFHCPRLIRSPFYDSTWNINAIERHSLFIHQGNYPIKGLHFVFEALPKIKRVYPDVKLYISGNDFMSERRLIDRLLPNGYVRYLKTLIKKYKIEENIEFTGYLNAESLAKRLETIHTVIVPSAIENAPNSLAEAEIVGTPVVASFVGGNMDMLEHGKDGFLYVYNEPNMLAEYITRIFESDDLACSLSANSRQTARNRHDKKLLESTLISIYDKIIEDGK